MIREEYLRRLMDEAYVDLYLSANDGARIYWPWRMQPPKEANDRYRNACENYIIDSDPQDASVTNKDVLDTAFRLDAEVASLSDVYRDKDGTVDALLKGMELYDDHSFDGKLLLPLQDPYVECYKEIGEPENHLIGIGGLKDFDELDHIHSKIQLVEYRIKSAKNLREYTGKGVHIHGFGWGPTGKITNGPSAKLAKAIRNDPVMLDSLDYSTPVQSAPLDQSAGKERASVTASWTGYKLIHDLREVSSFATRDSEDMRSKGQSGLEVYQ